MNRPLRSQRANTARFPSLFDPRCKIASKLTICDRRNENADGLGVGAGVGLGHPENWPPP